jgi:hypothetical protein
MIAFFMGAFCLDIAVLYVAGSVLQKKKVDISIYSSIKILSLLMVLSFPVTLLFEILRCWSDPRITFSWGPWVVPFCWNGMLMLSPMHLLLTILWFAGSFKDGAK